jgi:hypothetical protein
MISRPTIKTVLNIRPSVEKNGVILYNNYNFDNQTAAQRGKA